MPFIVSLPFSENAPGNASDQFRSIKERLPFNPSAFEIPTLKVGTLDNLMECSDDLVKMDTQIENITFKMLNLLDELTQSQTPDANAFVSKQGQQSQVTEKTDSYIANFKWNEAQFPMNKPLKQLLQNIQEQVLKGEENIRTRLSDYNDIKTRLQNYSKKQGGTLAVRPITQIVKEYYEKERETEPLQSEYMTTLFVAVPSSDEKKWLRDYSTLGGNEFVVPDSSRLILKESDYCLFNVILFKKTAEAFKHSCRENKFVVREYNAKDEVTADEAEEMKAQTESKKNQLVRWLKNTFSESFSAYVHMKAIRVFVESILRYGLPPNFVSVLLQVDQKKREGCSQDSLELGSAASHRKIQPGP